MKWAEFEAATKAQIQAEEEAIAEADRELQNQRAQAHQEELGKKEAQRLEIVSQMSEALEALKVKEIVEAVKEGVWGGEGNVTPIDETSLASFLLSDKMRMGYSLESAPYRVPKYEEAPLGNVTVNLRTETSKFSISVESKQGYDVPEGNLATNFTLMDDGLFDVRMARDSQRTIVADICSARSEIGMRGQFPQRFRQDRWIRGFDSSEENNGKFNPLVLEGVDNRRKLGSLPGQIREWTDSIIDQMPLQLRETGHLGFWEIRDWTHTLLNHNRLQREADRIFVRAFYPGISTR